MSDEQVAQACEDETTPTQIGQVTAFKADRDWFLQEVVELANFGLGIGITLLAEGAVISGILIGGKQFFEELGAEITNGNYTGAGDGGKLLRSIGEGWSRLSQAYVKPEDADGDWVAPEPAFIHLKDARIYAPGQVPLPSNKGVLWRGKLNAISGFSIGNFDPPS